MLRWVRSALWSVVTGTASTVTDSRRVTSTGWSGSGCSEATGLLLAMTVASPVVAVTGASSEGVIARVWCCRCLCDATDSIDDSVEVDDVEDTFVRVALGWASGLALRLFVLLRRLLELVCRRSFLLMTWIGFMILWLRWWTV